MKYLAIRRCAITKKKKIITPDDKISLISVAGRGPVITGDNHKKNADNSNFAVVGIGASAGGLGAFEAFFSAMPPGVETGMAFVLVQHLAPDHKSILAELVKRYTRMKVFEVEDAMKVQPDCAYIIPPNKDMAFLNGTLHLMEPSSPRGMRLPIDFFFRSLAQDQRERSICIVLSGTGNDGMHGIRAVKGEGGMVMAQSPDSTEYDGMPRSAIATGLVDYILTPQQMPEQLIAYVKNAFGKGLVPSAASEVKAENALKKIFIILRSFTGHDFSHYKSNTISRRVERRMMVNKIETLENYVQYIQKKPEEVEALFRDLLIGVTNFFRDAEAFENFDKNIVESVLSKKPSGTALRVWVSGCSTGEEAYSIAIIFQEHLERLKGSCQIQIFATDIDARAIEAARAGIYPASIAADISPERLSRFFTHNPEDGTFRIKKIIRDMLIFSEQSLIKDPPFSKIDIISCRNLLIYMDGELQKKIIPMFHYALNASGYLFLGNSESIGDFADLFSVIDRKWKLYQRKDITACSGAHARASIMTPMVERDFAAKRSRENVAAAKISIREMTERELLLQYAPPCVIVNERGDILYIHGRTGKYLEPSPGEAGVNVLKMAREGLRYELTSALHKAAANNAPVSYPGLKVKTNGNFTNVDLKVRPLPLPCAEGSPALFMIILEDGGETALENYIKKEDAGSPPDGGELAKINELELRLKAKEEYLRSTLEEMETSNEELKSANEELQSVNEELQSANEELETSKEELQSVNEELSTVNTELQQKVADLSRVNNDMNNLLAGTNIGTLFLDHQLRVRRFTPAVRRVINLISADIGRPISDIVCKIKGYADLVYDTRTVLDTLIPKESEVQTPDGQWYQMRIQPYRTMENVIEGAVITFSEITEIKRIKGLL